MNQLKNVFTESLKSVMPISAIVLILSITIAPLDAGILVMFVIGTLLLIFGMSFFAVGSTISMEPLGGEIGKKFGRSGSVILPAICCFFLGILITVAEPDLQVLAEQVPSVPNFVLIISVAVGVGVFLVLSLLRTVKGISLSKMLAVLYAIVMAVAFFAPKDFTAAAFDSGGVTTGPITVPFIMALGVGMASLRGGKHSGEDSFGLVALCSVGPIISVLILSIFYKPTSEASETVIASISNTREAFLEFARSLPSFAKEVITAFLPIIALFVIFSLIFKSFGKRGTARISVGFVYTYVGLVLFLTGANIGFMPAGRLIGATIASSDEKILLIPIGMLIGYFVVTAEPAVHSLKRQVEEVTNGAITQKSIGTALSIGVSLSVGISMLRVLTGIPIFPFVIAGYTVSLIISRFVPHIYTGIAFDSGGVASGPMTTAFILPFAVGACTAVGGNIMTDAFGVVAMVALAPLITIQVMGLYAKIKSSRAMSEKHRELSSIEDGIVYYGR